MLEDYYTIKEIALLLDLSIEDDSWKKCYQLFDVNFGVFERKKYNQMLIVNKKEFEQWALEHGRILNFKNLETQNAVLDNESNE